MRARIIHLSAFAALLAAAAICADERTKPTTKGESVLRVETRLVEVNVVAHDSKGNAITDLTRDDFTLLDNGKKVPIDVFSAISTATKPNALILPPHTFSNRVALPSATVILLDGLNTPVEDQTWARTEVIRFLEKLEPQDRVAIFLLGDQLFVLQNFTSDAKVLLEVLKNMKPREPRELAVPASRGITPGLAPSVGLGTALSNGGGISPSAAGGGGSSAAQTAEEAEMRRFEQFESSFFTIDRVRRTTAALTAIADFLAQFPGRKNLIWVTASFPVGIGFNGPRQPGDTRDQIQFTSEVLRAVKGLNNADLAIYPVDARALLAGGGEGATAAFATLLNGSKDPAGADFPEATNVYSTRGIMTELADDTGGRAYFNTNDLATVIRHAVDDYRADYTLGFYPHTRWDGRYHDLKVKVNRPGVRLRYRKGYFATRDIPDDEEHTTALLERTLYSPLDSTALGLTVTLQKISTVPPKRATFEIVMDPHDITFQDQNGDKTVQLEMLIAQLGADGKVLKSFRQTANLRIAGKGMNQVLAHGLTIGKWVGLGDGATTLELVVRDPASGNVGSVRIPLGT